MASTLYLMTFLASLTSLVAMLLKHRRIITGVLLFSILVTVNSFGRYLIAVSTTFDLARLGNLFVYVGGCYCPLVVTLILAYLAGLQPPLWLKNCMLTLSSLVFLLALTIGHSEIYYKRVWLASSGGCSYLLKEYGPAHVLFPLMISMYFCLMIFCLLYALHRHHEVSMRTFLLIVGLSVLICGCYVIERITRSHISYVSFGYLISMLLLTKHSNRINIYDLPTNIASCMEKNPENGFIEFDHLYRFLGCNQRAKALFPEIETRWNVDKTVPMDNSFLCREVVSWLFLREKGQRKTIRMGEQYYELVVHEIPYGNKACVGYLLELANRTAENRYLATVEHYNTNLKSEVQKQTEHITRMRDRMVLGMASMVESRDNSTGGHIRRTSQVMQVFARHLMSHLEELNITEDYLEMVCRAAPMHDLGKIAVDDAILRKQGKFTPEEFAIMKRHPTEGARIVRQILTGAESDDFVTIAENVAHYHHEKWNGQGYPLGLQGTEIPLEARLMALADVFDALVSKRCYKDSFSYDMAFEIIRTSLGTHFDPRLGQLFMECRPSLEQLYDHWKAEEVA